jgi:hypothetical protein
MSIFAFLTSQLTVQVVTIVILILSIALAALITKRYFSKHVRAMFYWSIGMWFFSLGMLLEILFAFNIYSEVLIDSYLLVVALIVAFLALGSMQFVKSTKLKFGTYAFFLFATIFLIYTLLVTKTGNILKNYVVAGNIPTLVAISSSLVTFPAAIILIVVALKSFMISKNKRLLSIIAGVIIVSIAGTLYIVNFPSLLYIAEFLGILLLWYGFI